MFLDKQAITIFAGNLRLSIERIPDFWMAQPTAASITGNLIGVCIDGNDFGSRIFCYWLRHLDLILTNFYDLYFIELKGKVYMGKRNAQH
jgi:hypothetical protein